MKAKPDGYTIMNPSELGWVNAYYAKAFDVKVWEKLTPIANFATDPVGLWEVRADSPFQTLGELLKAAKEKPGKLTIGISSSGVYDVMVISVGKAAGVEFKHVPFTGAGPSEVALLGGHIDIRFCAPMEAITMIRAGKTKGLAIQTEKRHPGIPEVPTFKELGYDVMTLTATRSIWGPPNMQKNIVDIYMKAIEKATRDSEFMKAAEEMFLAKVEFRSGQKMREEGVMKLEKQLRIPLTEFYSK